MNISRFSSTEAYQRRCALVGDALDQLQKASAVLRNRVELLGDPLHVQGLAEPLGDLDDADVAAVVEIGEVEDHAAELARGTGRQAGP